MFSTHPQKSKILTLTHVRFCPPPYHYFLPKPTTHNDFNTTSFQCKPYTLQSNHYRKSGRNEKNWLRESVKMPKGSGIWEDPSCVIFQTLCNLVLAYLFSLNFSHSPLKSLFSELHFISKPSPTSFPCLDTHFNRLILFLPSTLSLHITSSTKLPLAL